MVIPPELEQAVLCACRALLAEQRYYSSVALSALIPRRSYHTLLMVRDRLVDAGLLPRVKRSECRKTYANDRDGLGQTERDHRRIQGRIRAMRRIKQRQLAGGLGDA